MSAYKDQVIEIPRWVLVELWDDSECWFDHHGNCQGHGHSIDPGDICPNKIVGDILDATQAAVAAESPE